MGQTASGGLVKCCQTPNRPLAGSENVQQSTGGPRPINTSPSYAKPSRKKVSKPLDTSAFGPESKDLLRLTPSKRKLIMLPDNGEENPAQRKKAAIDIEEAQESLCKAATRGDMKAVQKAIASGASVSTLNSRGLTPLMQCAAAQGATAVEALQVLVDHGASVDTLDNNGWTALHYACRSGKASSAKYLLSVRADPTLITGDKHKKSTLMLATEDMKTDLVDHLVRKCGLKHHLNRQDSHGFTVLHHAMKVGSKDIVKLLLDEGAKARLRDCDGRQPFMVGCENGRLDCVKLFVGKDGKGKVDINAQDNQKRTALMLSCLNRYEDVAMLLVRKCKPDFAAQDEHGQSAVTIARAHGLQEVVACIYKKEHPDGEVDGKKPKTP